MELILEKYKTSAGNWKQQIGWDEIDKWKYEEGLSYKAIRDRCIELCGSAPSKGSLSPHFNEVVKENLRQRQRVYRAENVNVILGKKLDQFWRHTPPIELPTITESVRAKERGATKALEFSISGRISRFCSKGEKVKRLYRDCNFTVQQLLDSWKGTQNYDEDSHNLECAICGGSLNIVNDLWHMDHIDPRGKNTLENCAATHRVCNQMKSDLSQEEFQELVAKINNFNQSKNIS